MKLPPFQLHRPESREEALALLSELGGEAVPLAGGQSLLPALALRLAQPAHLIDLDRAGVSEIRPTDGKLAVSFLVRQAEALRSSQVAAEAPLLAAALAHVGHPETRSRGTVVGSIAHADPSAELPAVALASGAEIVLRSARGARTVAADSFFLAPFTTARAPDELVTEVRFSRDWASAGWSFQELSRRYNDFALVAVAALLRLDGRGKIAGLRLAYAGVGPGPLRAASLESALLGAVPDRATLAEAAARAAEELDPPADVLASAAYRRHVARILTFEALAEAAGRAGERER